MHLLSLNTWIILENSTFLFNRFLVYFATVFLTENATFFMAVTWDFERRIRGRRNVLNCALRDGRNSVTIKDDLHRILEKVFEKLYGIDGVKNENDLSKLWRGI